MKSLNITDECYLFLLTDDGSRMTDHGSRTHRPATKKTQNREIKMNNKYEIILYWDKTDEIYNAEVPELAGCMAHGKTEEDALANIKAAINLWIDTALKHGEQLPEPKGQRLKFA